VASFWSVRPVTAASRRNNAVHAQEFHHLPVVIVGVGHHILGELKTGLLPGAGSIYFSVSLR
jgi:hypothetical protein